MNAISCLARGKRKKKRNCFALIARFARERGRERQKGKKKMQGRRSDVCVQQVAISNYRIILILGFRGGWVNRPALSRLSSSDARVLRADPRRGGEKGREGGVDIIAATRSIYTRILPFTNSIARPLQFSSSPFDLAFFFFFFSHACGWETEKGNRARLVHPPLIDWENRDSILALLLYSLFSPFFFLFVDLFGRSVSTSSWFD